MDKKIKVCRSSGMPVKIESLEAFSDDWKKLYDKVMVRFGLDPEHPKQLDEATAKRVSSLLDKCEKRLLKKYPNSEHWNLMQTQAEMEAAVKQYGPIMLAMDSETNQLAYVIYDTQF